MANAIYIDTTLCTGCRGCQVACKQWHDLPAEPTRNMGTYQNPSDLSFSTYKLVRMSEERIDGRLQWLFFPDQCRQCIDAPCLDAAGDASAIYRDDATGAILYTANTSDLEADDIIASCPYNVPRKSEDGTLAKCDFCNDRIHNGEQPACVKTCPTGAMNFGDRDDIVSQAEKRLAEVRRRFPKAMLADHEDVNVIYLVAHAPEQYHENVIGSAKPAGITRQLALKRMLRPFTRTARALTT